MSQLSKVGLLVFVVGATMLGSGGVGIVVMLIGAGMFILL